MTENYAICFVVDSTASMGVWINALVKILPELILMTAITDYDDGDTPFSFSGWVSPDDPSILMFAKEMRPKGGGGCPEAVKTALYCLVDAVNELQKKCDSCEVHVLHITDARAHMTVANLDFEGTKEKKLLGPKKFDWIHMSDTIKALPVRYSVFTSIAFAAYFHLAELTGGHYFYIGENNVNAEKLFNALVKIMNGWFGCLELKDGSGYGGFVNTSKFIKVPKTPTEADLCRSYDRESIEVDISVPKLAAIVGNMAQKMRSDPVYAEYAIPILLNIIENCLIVLCTNTLLGRLWREFCKRRADPRRAEYMMRMDINKSKFSEADRLVFDQWNKNSYNASEEIRCELNEFVMRNGVSDGLFLTYNPDSVIHPKDILEFSRACKPSDQALITSILIRMTIVHYPDYVIQPYSDEEKQNFSEKLDKEGASLIPPFALPLNLPPKRLFSLLLHLAAPGCELTLRPSMIIAMLAARCECVLKDLAVKFLDEYKGKWLNWSMIDSLSSKKIPVIAENFALSFVHLLNSYQSALTTAECSEVEKMLKFAFLVRIMSMELECEYFREGSMNGIYIDYQMVCKICQFPRPISLINEVGDCGYCAWNLIEFGPNRYAIQPVVPAEDTFMVQCTVCQGFYARNKLVQVFGRHRCHVCYHSNSVEVEVESRSGAGKRKLEHEISFTESLFRKRLKSSSQSPYVACSVCKLHFISYHGLPNDTCAACMVTPNQRKAVFDNITVKIVQLAAQNPAFLSHICNMIGVNVPDMRNASMLSQLGVFQTLEMFESVPAVTNIEYDQNIVYNNRTITNTKSLLESVKAAIREREFELPFCSVCCDTKPSSELFPACGRSHCTQRLCFECGENWYGDIKPGCIINMRHLSCPFCVKTPTVSTMKRWNKLAANLSGSAVYDPRYYYAWCLSCNKPMEFGAKECLPAGAPPPVVTNFNCELCKEARAQAALLAEQIRQRELDITIEREQAQNERERQVREYYETVGRRRVTYAQNRRAHTVQTIVASRANPALIYANRTRPCPFCVAPIYKISGCNHISCICGGHFCFKCGFGAKCGSDVYEHMSSSHGSFYDDEDGMYEEY